ncbi:hypothetical protein [Rhodococcus phenolicus]|uniref:hypothetical protein n=1 Tax=Rhodococcus phenolicus TaxID=263849 RepID=UPI000B253295|nr:hypothetical protein [Rhodococcus phenolicus]
MNGKSRSTSNIRLGVAVATTVLVTTALALVAADIRSGSGVGADAWRADPIGPDDLAG